MRIVTNSKRANRNLQFLRVLSGDTIILPMHLKLISLNLWWGGKLWDNIVDFLEREKPDILALQEVYESKEDRPEPYFKSIKKLQEALPYLTQAQFAPALQGLSQDKIDYVQGNAVLSKFPLRQKSVHFFDVAYGTLDYEGADFAYAPRNIQHVTADINGTDLNIFNLQGIWGKNPLDNERRMNMGKSIAELVAGKKRTVLCGDFNVDIRTQSVAQIEEAGLVNIFKGKINSSMNTLRRPEEIFSGIAPDMIFISPDIKLISADCPKVDISDHLPQIITFEI
ncbi:MAG TPA: endonuclease/exonuclease/phosphatase family protein [Candidatus Paceibacterota bacterium]